MVTRTVDVMHAKPLLGKHGLVTGAGRGVGLGIALALAEAGCHVAVNFKEEESGSQAESAVQRLLALGVDSFSLRGDVSKSEEVTSIFDDLSMRFPKLDVLVNNAGIQVSKGLLELTESDWDTVMNTNAKGCFLCTQAAARWMVTSGGGSIVNIGSGCNKTAFPDLASYVASKGAVEMFTKAASLELGPHGIRVNCVAPGAIEVERTLHDDPLYRTHWGSLTPLRRVGQPEDVGRSVVYFASTLSEFVTGQTLWVDGGVFSRAPWPSSTE